MATGSGCVRAASTVTPPSSQSLVSTGHFDAPDLKGPVPHHVAVFTAVDDQQENYRAMAAAS